MLLLQVLPLGQELKAVTGYISDPFSGLDAVCKTGLLHKYHGRALMIITGTCAGTLSLLFSASFYVFGITQVDIVCNLL